MKIGKYLLFQVTFPNYWLPLLIGWICKVSTWLLDLLNCQKTVILRLRHSVTQTFGWTLVPVNQWLHTKLFSLSSNWNNPLVCVDKQNRWLILLTYGLSQSLSHLSNFFCIYIFTILWFVCTSKIFYVYFTWYLILLTPSLAFDELTN